MTVETGSGAADSFLKTLFVSILWHCFFLVYWVPMAFSPMTDCTMDTFSADDRRDTTRRCMGWGTYGYMLYGAALLLYPALIYGLALSSQPILDFVYAALYCIVVLYLLGFIGVLRLNARIDATAAKYETNN